MICDIPVLEYASLTVRLLTPDKQHLECLLRLPIYSFFQPVRLIIPYTLPMFIAVVQVAIISILHGWKAERLAKCRCSRAFGSTKAKTKKRGIILLRMWRGYDIKLKIIFLSSINS